MWAPSRTCLVRSAIESRALRAEYGAGNGARTRDPQLGRLMLYQLSYSRSLPTKNSAAARCSSPTARAGIGGGEGRIRTSEAYRRQIYSLFPLTTREPPHANRSRRSLGARRAAWSWREDLNPQPSAYKADALPVELRQHDLEIRPEAHTHDLRIAPDPAARSI